MSNLIIITGLLFCNLSLLGQDILLISPGAKGGSLGSIKTIHNDILSMYGNEAGLAYLSDLSFYLSAERRFNNEALNYYSATVASPTSWGSFGLLLTYYGFDLYNEQFIGLAYARKLSPGLALGIQFDYLQVHIPSYGNKSAFTAELGLLARLTPQIQVGFHAYNPLDIKLTDEQSLTSAFSLGIEFQPSDQVRIMAELEKITGHRENIKGGISYRVAEQFALRLGVNTNPSLITFGVGYQMASGLAIDLGSTVHQQLGISPLAGVGYQRLKSP